MQHEVPTYLGTRRRPSIEVMPPPSVPTSRRPQVFAAAVAQKMAEDASRGEFILRGKFAETEATILANHRVVSQTYGVMSSLIRIRDGWSLEEPLQVIIDELSNWRKISGSPELPPMAEPVSVHAHPQEFKSLAENIFGHGRIPPLLVVTADDRGGLLSRDPCQSDRFSNSTDFGAISNETIVLIQSAKNVELVANTSGRTWADLLQQVASYPQFKPKSRVSFCVADAIRSVRPVDANRKNSDGMQHVLHLKRGRQARLTVQDHGQETDPLAQQKEAAEAQNSVDDVWKTIESFISSDLGQTRSLNGDQIIRLGLSGSDGYQEQLMVDADGDVSLPALEEGENTYQYMVDLNVRQGRVNAMTIDTSGEGIIEVQYENPWSRQPPANQFARNRLRHPDDIDEFDLFHALKPQTTQREAVELVQGLLNCRRTTDMSAMT